MERTTRGTWWRKALGAGAALAVGLVSTVVLAEWVATGTGSGAVRAVEAQALVTEAATPDAALYPGGTAALVVQVRNPNPFPVTLTSVTGNGEITSDAIGCDATNHGVTFTDQTGLSIPLPAGTTTTVTLSDAVAMAPTSADACQGATFTVPVSLNGGTGAVTDPDTGGDELVCDDGNPDTIDVIEGFSCAFYYVYYVDADGDGYGAIDSGTLFTSDTAPAGYASVSGDCDDANAAANPGATEDPANGIDDDCDGNVDFD